MALVFVYKVLEPGFHLHCIKVFGGLKNANRCCITGPYL